ncbi:MAG: M48 family metallopeptidase [Bacteroidota bacterium]
MNPRPIVGLKTSDYEHPLDAKTMKILQDTRGLENVIRRFYDMGVEKVIKLQYTGSSLRLTPQSFPKVYRSLELACTTLGYQGPVPPIYLERSEQFTALTLGADDPFIVLSSECIDKLQAEELLFIFGREIAKIKSNHILYQELGFIFPELMDAMSSLTLGLSSILSTGLKYALFNWAQMAEYTADRGGLLACQDIFVVKNYYAKIAGLPERYWAQFPIEDLETQAKQFEGLNEKTFEKFVRFLYGNNLYAIARARELMNWTESGAYNQIIARKLA